MLNLRLCWALNKVLVELFHPNPENPPVLICIEFKFCSSKNLINFQAARRTCQKRLIFFAWLYITCSSNPYGGEKFSSFIFELEPHDWHLYLNYFMIIYFTNLIIDLLSYFAQLNLLLLFSEILYFQLNVT